MMLPACPAHPHHVKSPQNGLFGMMGVRGKERLFGHEKGFLPPESVRQLRLLFSFCSFFLNALTAPPSWDKLPFVAAAESAASRK